MLGNAFAAEKLAADRAARDRFTLSMVKATLVGEAGRPWHIHGVMRGGALRSSTMTPASPDADALLETADRLQLRTELLQDSVERLRVSAQNLQSSTERLRSRSEKLEARGKPGRGRRGGAGD